MYSAGLADAAAAGSAGAGAATSATRSSSPPHTVGRSPHRPPRDDSCHHQARGGGEGGAGARWEQGDYRGAEGDRGWAQEGAEDGYSDDGVLLVRWSEGLDFDRQALSVSAAAAGPGSRYIFVCRDVM